MSLITPQLKEYLQRTSPHQEFLKQQYWKYQFKLVLQELLTPKKVKRKKTTSTYYEENKELIKEKRRVYRMLNADKIKERNRDYYYKKHHPHLL